MTTVKKRVEALDENKRFEARAHWERCYDTALVLLLQVRPSSGKPGGLIEVGTAEALATRAALIADQALLRWMERW